MDDLPQYKTPNEKRHAQPELTPIDKYVFVIYVTSRVPHVTDVTVHYVLEYAYHDTNCLCVVVVD